MLNRFKFRAWSRNRLDCMISHEMLKGATGGMVKMLNGIGVIEDKIPGGLFLPFEDDDLIFMQCTGRKDKNGNPIFEGDIIQREDKGIKFNCEVVWHKNAWELREKKLELEAWLHISKYEDWEIIGNIYENPELLLLKGD